MPVDRLPPAILIPPLRAPFDVTITPPGSKSITNRALLLAALAKGTSTLRGALADADDAQVMLRAIETLGAPVRVERTTNDQAFGNATLHITGVNGCWKPRVAQPTLDLHNAGTATRFLAAAAVLGERESGPITIDGNLRMRARPIRELADALGHMGVRVEHTHAEGYPPMRVWPLEGGRVVSPLNIPTTSSSQFISALMLIAPFLEGGLALRFTGAITSAPYVHMTRFVLEAWGVSIDADLGRAAPTLFIGGQSIKSRTYAIEPDASGAVPFWGAAALASGSTVRVPGVNGSSIQGDAGFAQLLARAGATMNATVSGTSITGTPRLGLGKIDLSGMPDTAMVAAVLACFSDGPTTLRGLRTLRVKETDRLAALQTELTKIGARVEIETMRDDEGLRIWPPAELAGSLVCVEERATGRKPAIVEFDTYDDHRMAMALALVGLRRGNVVIRDPACVRKTYPTFWRDFASLYSRS